MNAFLFLMCLAAQDPTAEAKKLLDALVPPLKDPPYSQFEFERGPVKGMAQFGGQKAWRVDTKNGDVEGVFLYDGREFLKYWKKSNRYLRSPGESLLYLSSEAGALAEIHHYGNTDRFLRDAKQVTLKKEKLDGVECTHVMIVPKKEMDADFEFHFWIDSNKKCKRYQRKQAFQGKVSEQTWNYKVIDPPTTTEETFTYQVPADAKNMKAGDK